MFAYINGLIIDKNEKSLVVLAQNIGYRVFVPTELIAQTRIDEKIQLFLHTAVREDSLTLYGFGRKEELVFFEQLIGVSGIGPKTALEILSSPVHLTKQAIFSGDVGMLTKIKGLGKKTAERLILELKNKINPLDIGAKGVMTSAYNEEAVEALVGLGYEKYTVVQKLSHLPPEIKKTEEVIKYFLKNG